MKKYLFLFLFLLLPITVFAKEDIVMSDIVLKNISSNTVILRDAEIKDNKIDLDLRMYEVGDFIEYQFAIENNTNKDYQLYTKKINKTIDHIKYQLSSKDKSFVVKKGKSKTFTLKASYVDEIDENDFETRIYETDSKITINVDRTGVASLFTQDIPLTLQSNIEIDSSTPNPCGFSGSGSPSMGSEYVNGQFTYRYNQKVTEDGSWADDRYGYRWGVKLTDPTSTDPVTTPMCSSIGNYSVNNLFYTFVGSQTTSIDIPLFSAEYMTGMFKDCTNITELTLSNFSIKYSSALTSMFEGMISLKKLDLSYMSFQYSLDGSFFQKTDLSSSPIEELNVTGWKISRYIYNLNSLFSSYGTNGLGGSGLKKIIGLDTWDTSKINYMNQMFQGLSSIEEIDLSSFNTSSVSSGNMKLMFDGCTSLTSLNLDNFIMKDVPENFLSNTSSLKRISAKNWKLPKSFSNVFFRTMGGGPSIEEIDVTGWDLSKTPDISGLFGKSIDSEEDYALNNIVGLDTWNVSQINNMNEMFYGLNHLKEFNLTSWSVKANTSTDQMFTGCTGVENSYAKTETDAEKLNASSDKPDNVNFIIDIPDDRFDADLIIKSVDFIDTEGLTIEHKEAYLKDNRIQLDVKMYEVGDSISYKFVVKNKSIEAKIFDDDFINTSPYIQYKIIPQDKSSKIKGGEEKEFTLVATYENEVDRDLFKGGKYYAGKDILLEFNSVPIINPETRNDFLIVIFVILFSYLGFKFIKNKKVKKGLVGLSLIAFVIPFVVSAEDAMLPAGIDANIRIEYVKPTFCTFDGELVPGAEYVNGQYTYHYMQNYVYDSSRQYINGNWTDVVIDEWQDMNSDGWGVHITDPTSTDPVTTTLCTVINDKPVTSMRDMFYNSQTTSIDTSSFETSSVETMNAMFRKAPNITELDVHQFDMTEVVDISYMFYYTDGLTSLDLSYSGGDNLTTLSYFFPYNSTAALKDVDMSYFNFGKIASLGETSLYGKSVENINLSHADMSYATSVNALFEYWTNLKTVDMSYVDMSHATSITDLCFRAQNLESIDLSYAKTDSVQDISYAFADASNLASITLTGINLENVKRTYYTFRSTSITTLDLSEFRTPYVEDMNYLISSCPNLVEVNLSNLGSDSLDYISNMISSCSSLKKITMDNFNFGIANVSGFLYLGYNSNSLEELSLRGANIKNTPNPSYLFSSARLSNLKKLDLTGMIFGSDMSYFFSPSRDFPTAETILLDDIDTSAVTNMNYLFYNSPITSFDFSKLDTSNVTTMEYAFYYSNISSIDLSSCDFSNLVNANSMFYKSYASEMNLTDFNSSNIQNMSYMFGSCSNLTSINLSNWDISNVTTASCMFNNCTNLTSVNLSGWVFPSNIYLGSMFYGTAITSLDFGDVDTSNLTSMSYWFSGMTGLTTIDLSNVDASNVTIISGLFSGCTGLTSVNWSDINLDNITDMSNLFSRCTGLTSIDFGNIDTSSLTNINNMFNGCSNLTSITWGSFNTEHITNMSYLFEGCSSLTSIDLSGFDTSNVTTMFRMFKDCSSLTSIDVSGFVTSNVTDIDFIFQNCSSLTTINLSNFDTSKVIYMQGVIAGCSNLTSFNFSSFQTGTVKYMNDMFNGCTSLTTINVSNFDTSSVITMQNMFKDCTITSLDLSNFNTSAVTNFSGMFSGCANLTSLNLNNFVTTAATNMSSMFQGCTGLTTLDLSSFDLTNVTSANTKDMFSGCTSLTTGYARTQADADKFNNSSNKPSDLTFVVRT